MAQAGGTRCTGNTKTRAYCITIFQKEELEIFKGITAKYKISGEEICPTTGRIHYQSYLYLVNARTFASIKKQLPTSHIEKARGNASENKTYCSKDGKVIFEEGELPNDNGKRQPNADELKKMTDEEIIDLDARCHKAYINARDLLNADIDIDDWAKEIKVYYIQGPSGIGKTEAAKQIVRDNKEKYGTKINQIKYENGFYSGIGNAKIAIYDDFRDSHMRASEFINLIDYNKHSLNIKGGSKVNNYEMIIITSIQRVNEIYANMGDEPRQQWLRRINIIDMFKQNEDVDIEWV